LRHTLPLLSAPDLARIPAGEFLMGSSDAGIDERPIHPVHVGEFFIGRFPVTNDEYARFIRAAGYSAPVVRELPIIASGDREAMFREIAASYEWHSAEPPAGHGNHPVVLIRYDDAMAYCGWLADALGRVVRLPTEAEWEKAARGGGEGQRYPWGPDIDASRGNFLGQSAVKREHGTRSTGTYPPNGYGLCDMAGNVWEWVADWYETQYYAISTARDPLGPAAGTMRIVRGGSWVSDDVNMLRCAYRHQVPPDTYAYSLGFRIVCPE
jgi:formylglycine-generating enzyme required for sulfatase activity